MYVENKADGERTITAIMQALDRDAAVTIQEIRGRWRQQLLDAAAYIEAHGWCQDRYSYPNGSVCVMGALWHAATGRVPTDDDAEPPLMVQSLECCVLHTLGRKRGLASWNDRHDCTQRKVTNALRRAAAKLD